MLNELSSRKTDPELDGFKLMMKAFNPDSPIIKLTHLSTQSEKDIQQGYMHIFAGSMMGIRNPKAHANFAIDANRGRHFLYLASLLMKVVKEPP